MTHREIGWLALILSARLSLAGTVWCVDNQAAGANTGAGWADAFTNLTEAVETVWGAGQNAGATLLVRQRLGAPDYPVQIVIGAAFADGAPGMWNRVAGWSADGYERRPVLRVARSPGAVFTLGESGVVSRSGYEFRGLAFQGSSANDDCAVRLCRTSSNVRFLSNTCVRASFSASDNTSDVSTNLLLQGNRMLAGSAFDFRGDTDVRIVDNLLLTGSRTAINLRYLGARFHIEGNIIEAADGISSQSYRDVRVARNRIRASYRAAIYADNYPDNWTICNNVFHDVTGSDPTLPDGVGVAFRVKSNPALTICNNTMIRFPEPGARAIWFSEAADKAVVFNNLIVGVATGLVFDAGCAATADWNAFWQIGTTHAGAAAGAHDQVADPLFWDEEALVLLPLAAGVATGGASALGGASAPEQDYYGTPRTAPVAIGAIEQAAAGGPRVRLVRTTFFRDEAPAPLKLEIGPLFPNGTPMTVTARLGDLPAAGAGVPAPVSGTACVELDTPVNRLRVGRYPCRVTVSNAVAALTEVTVEVDVAPALDRDGMLFGDWRHNMPGTDWLAFYRTLGINEVGGYASEIGPDALERLGLDGIFHCRFMHTAAPQHDFSPGHRPAIVASAEAANRLTADYPQCARMIINDEMGAGHALPDDAQRAGWFDAWAEAQLGFGVLTNGAGYLLPTIHNGPMCWFPSEDRPGADGLFAEPPRSLRFLRWWLSHGETASDYGSCGWRNKALAATTLKNLRPGLAVHSEPLYYGGGEIDALDGAATWEYDHRHVRGAMERAHALTRARGKTLIPLLGAQIGSYGTVIADWPVAGATHLLCKTADDLIRESWISTAMIPSDGLVIYSLADWFKGLRGLWRDANTAIYCESGSDVAWGSAMRNDILPMGKLLKGVPNAQRPVALLLPESTTYLVAGEKRGNWIWGAGHHYPRFWYEVLDTLGLPYDVLGDDNLAPGTLARYQAVVFPMGFFASSFLSGELTEAGAAGTRIVVDSYCAQTYPNQEVWPQQYYYTRTGSEAAYWRQVTNTLGRAADLAQSLRASAAVPASATGRTGPLMVNVREVAGARYVAVINNCRTNGPYTEAVGSLPALTASLLGVAPYQPYGRAQQADVRIRAPAGAAICDFTGGERVATVYRDGVHEFVADLPGSGGRLYCVYPHPPERLAVSLPAACGQGETAPIIIQVIASTGAVAPGRYLVTVEILAPDGRRHDQSGDYVVRDGRAEIAFTPPLNDWPGAWRVTVRERSSAIETAGEIPVGEPVQAWYVDNRAAGRGTGSSWTDAFVNFTAAVSNVWGAGANTGATIYVRQALGAPDYNVGTGLVLGAGFADGMPDAYNRIVGWTGDGYAARPRLTRTDQGSVIELGEVNQTSRQCYEFRNLSFRGKDLYFSSSLRLCHRTSNIRFLENVCTNASFRADDGTSTPGKTNLLIQANTFGTGSACVFRYAADVQILDNRMPVRAGTAAAIALGYVNDRVLIRGNAIESGDCISSQSTKDLIVERNRMQAGYRAAIFADYYPERWTIRNNIIHDTTGSHASWPEGRGIRIFRHPSLVVVNNTFHNFPEAGAMAIDLDLNVKNAVIFNNIFSGVSSGLVARTGSTLANDANVFWQVDTPHGGVAEPGPVDRIADPRFKAPAVFDFRLGNVGLMASAVGSLAGHAAPADDYFGVRRGPAVSFGAVQTTLPGMVILVR